jgi:hypothetical protein
MFYGSSKIEVTPGTCPAGLPWGPPVGGLVRMMVGWLPCHCPGTEGHGGHRTYHCEALDCPSPWVFVGGHDPDHPNAGR